MRFILHGLSIPFSITHRMLMLFCAFLFVPFLSAQICTDSVYQLQEFELLDKCSPLSEHAAFSVGTQLLQADSAAISRSSSSSLSEYLVKNTPIYIKESGNGMLSTVSLRGTASSHTAVNWNGININPLTMGQVDFSQLPMFFFDEVMVHPGGESALYGSGAIGGSILLGSSRLYKKTLSTELQQSMGSYGSSFSGLKFKVGGKSWQSRTAVMYNRSDNNFKINVPSFSGNDVQEQRNADYYNYGIQQDLNFKLTAKSELQFNAWHSFYFRSIQPSFQNNLDSASYESLSNAETRVLATYTYSGKWKTENRFGSIYNYQENLGDVIAFQNLIFSSDWMRAWRKVSLKAGVNYQYILPEVYAYSFGVEESRFDVYAMTKYRLLKFMDIGLNLRQGMVTGIAVPFTPSFGLSVLPLRKLHHTLLLRTNIARSFKVPTLNDRYWGGLDNRYLQAEDGRNFELGMNYDYLNKRYRFKTNATAYYNLVKNWILWMPRGDIWKPQNVDLVLANGLEIKMTHEYSWLRNTLFLVTNYNYTLTTVKEGFNDMTPFLGRQMPLLPKHTASALVQYGYKQFSAQVNSNYVGERATSNIYDVMDAYLLFDVSSAYKFKFKHSALTLRAAVNNLFNVDYQSMPYKAMPWRNYQLTLNYLIQ